MKSFAPELVAEFRAHMAEKDAREKSASRAKDQKALRPPEPPAVHDKLVSSAAEPIDFTDDELRLLYKEYCDRAPAITACGDVASEWL